VTIHYRESVRTVGVHDTSSTPSTLWECRPLPFRIRLRLVTERFWGVWRALAAQQRCRAPRPIVALDRARPLGDVAWQGNVVASHLKAWYPAGSRARARRPQATGAVPPAVQGTGYRPQALPVPSPSVSPPPASSWRAPTRVGWYRRQPSAISSPSLAFRPKMLIHLVQSSQVKSL